MDNRPSPEQSSFLHYSEAIANIDLLCFRSTSTVVQAVIPPEQGGGFVRSISPRIVYIAYPPKPHATTTAQCIAALQALSRVIDRLHVTELPSSTLTFGMSREKVTAEDLKEHIEGSEQKPGILPKQLPILAKGGLADLANPPQPRKNFGLMCN